MDSSYEFDGSIISLSSSTFTTRSEQGDEAPLGQPSSTAQQQGDHSLQQHSPPAPHTLPATATHAESFSRATSMSSVPLLPSSTTATTPPPDQHDPFSSLPIPASTTPAAPLHVTNGQHHPTTPPSLDSTSQSSPRLMQGQARSLRSRASTAGSSSASNTSEQSGGEEGAEGIGLLMPSMSISQGRLGGRSGDDMRGGDPTLGRGSASARSAATATSPRATRILLLGKTTQERRTLADLLARGGEAHHHSEDEAHETDEADSVGGMSASFLSTTSATRFSDRSRSSSSPSVAVPHHYPSDPVSHSDDEHEHSRGLLDSLPSPSADLTFVHPLHEDHTDELATTLRIPLEKMEAMLDSRYPASEGLLGLVARAGTGIEACFMLMSSRTSRFAPHRAFEELTPLPIQHPPRPKSPSRAASLPSSPYTRSSSSLRHLRPPLASHKRRAHWCKPFPLNSAAQAFGAHREGSISCRMNCSMRGWKRREEHHILRRSPRPLVPPPSAVGRASLARLRAPARLHSRARPRRSLRLITRGMLVV